MKQKLGLRYPSNYKAVTKKVADCFDFEYRNIETCYMRFITGEKYADGSYPKTVENWVFICKNDDGKYYLYSALI